MAVSTHEVPIVNVKMETHPNADSLSVVTIDGYTVCVRTEDWEDGQLAAYIPPDSIVKTTRPEFAFLAREGRDVERIRVKKLRGIVSMGLLVPAPAGFDIGEDVADTLEVEHYEPTMKILMGDSVPGPPGIFAPKYDVDTIRKYHRLFVDNEAVIVTEKIHGCFMKDTPVLMSDGNYQNIQDIIVGDTVMSYDENQQTFIKQPVTSAGPTGETKQWIKLEFENGVNITCTLDHLFFTTDGWIRADKLTEKHNILSYN